MDTYANGLKDTFNTNAITKTSEFDQNASDKTDDFDDNASAKTTAFNDNATAKIAEYDAHVSELQSQVDDLTTVIETELETATVEGTTLDVSDSAEYPGKIIPGANLEQKQLSGKNLWRFSNLNWVTDVASSHNIIDENILEVTSTNNTYANSKFRLDLPDGTYTFKLGKVTNSNANMSTKRMTLSKYINNTRTAIQHIDEGNSYTFTISNNEDEYYVLEFWAAYATALVNTARFENIQIEEGSAATDCEPYCGGQPSPNPDYPQEIKVVTGDNVVKHVGKNEFYGGNINTIWYDSNSGKFTSSTNFKSFIMKVKPNTQYVISKKNASNRFAIVTSQSEPNLGNYYKRLVVGYNGSNTSYAFETQNDENYILFGVYNGTDETEIAKAIEEIQLEEGTTPTQYEPFREEEYELDLWKENEFDKDNANIYGGYLNANGVVSGTGTAQSDTIVYIECKPNTTYHLKKMQQIDTEYNRFRVGCTSEIPVREMQVTNFLKYDDGTTETECVYKTSNTARYLLFYCGKASETTSREQLLNSIQIQEAIELCKIGDYEDILFKNVIGDENYNAELEDGAWYKKGVIQKEIFDGSIDEGWQINSGAISDKTIYLTSDAIDNKLKENYMGISNYLINSRISLWSTEVQAMQLMTNVSRHIRLRVDKTTASNTDGFRTWLSTHNLELYYASAETTYTKITDSTLISQLEALRKAKWFKVVNHWWTETDNLEPVLKGTYKQSNNLRLQALEQAIVALGGV